MIDVITAINAKPETIKDFLGNFEYTIPDYQRPYSWGKEECIRLWEDITEYYEEKRADSNSPYFLGNVVVYNENMQRNVVDGQQRLITLNLLIRALFTVCGDFTALESILYKSDPITNKVITDPFQIRITHNVLGDDENLKLEKVLLNQEGESNYQDNYELFLERINDYFKSNNYSAEDKHQFILSLIGNVVILPIECTNFDSALTIFETINNRGMDLNDSDIFKSKLYKFSGDNKDEFIISWNDLVQEVEKNDLTLKDIFSDYMHVLRGGEGNVDSIVGLRKFYDQNGGNFLKDWEDVLNSLNKIVWAWNYITDKNSDVSIEILNWSTVLQKYPNSYWEYPIMTFLHENIYKEKDIFKFEKNEELLLLMKLTVRYCYWKWLKYRGVGAIKDTIFKVVREIARKGDYGKIYQTDIDQDFNEKEYKGMKNTVRNILDKDLGKGLKGMCLLSTVLNKEQRRLIPDNYHVEHILPQKWGHYKYSGWSDATYNQFFNKLGNLVILERQLNIKSSHRFFIEKKFYYNKSNIADVRNLGKLNDWTPDEFKQRNSIVINRLIDFLVGN